MSAPRRIRFEDQSLFSICLDVFTDPVSTPCGHNFCKHCIDQHWNQSLLYKCPFCNENFGTKPQLNINTQFSEMVSQFRCEVQQKSSSSSSEQQAAKPGEVLCNVHTGTKVKALKSCLVCLVSYCEIYLEPHLTMKDQRNHDGVPLKEECEGKKAELRKTEDEIQQMIQKRRLKIEEIKESADRQKAEGVQVFTALKELVERCLNELIKEIEDKQKTAVKQADYSFKDLEQEISELMKRGSEVEQLLKSEDHLHLFKSFSSLKAASPTKDWRDVIICPSSYEGTVVRAVVQLEETTRKLIKKYELKWAQQYEVDVTLDSDTTERCLMMENKKDCVDFRSGQRVDQQEGKVDPSPPNGVWVVSLAEVSDYLDDESTVVFTFPKALNDPPVLLSIHSHPKKVGVFVDYEEGPVSFYYVDAPALIYSFTGCSFIVKIYPYFDPGENDDGDNSDPLIITPVNQ
ncbi:E3 ubiquitin-protein ligase TRIM21-like [Pholidichthys leucotaenia]